MNSLYFWKSWNSPYKQLYVFLLSLFLFSIVALSYAAYTGMEEVVKWEVETELEPVKVVVDQFARNLFNFTVESESFYALDKFVTTEAQVNLPYAYLFLIVTIIGVIFILTTFSFLDLYWFMAGMLAFLFFLFSMKIEMLQLFGRIDRIPMVSIFLVYGGISFIFNSYYKSASYLFRLSCFSLLTIVLAFLIARFSLVSNPFLYLANFGSLFPLLVTVLFVLVIGYDIIKGFLFVVSGSKTAGSKNAILNFVFASLLYLINVVLLLLKKLYLLNLDIVYLNPFVLLVVSALLGIWMFRKRTEMFSTVLPFAPAGAYVYLSLAIISISGAAYAFINGNIGMIESYERIIVYGHLFLGFIFVIYVLVNFGVMFDKKISIYEIVYKPERMTFLVVPAISITMCVFFFLYQKKYPYHLAMSGYYTYAGDVMTYEGQYPLSFQYYKQAVSFDYPNHRANYSIASLCAYLEDKETSKGYFENALYRDPSPQSYIGLGNVYMETGELFKALFTVQEGIKKFPQEGRLYNNLAVLYQKTNLADSAIYYFLKSKEMLGNKEVAASNILYLLAKKNLIEEADSIIKTENYPGYISFINNKLAILNQIGKKSDVSFDGKLIKDSILNANTYAYLVNANINSLKDSSGSLIVIIDSLRNKRANEKYKDPLTCQLALKKYYSGNRFGAMQDMILLNVVSSQSFEYPTILGSWMLEQEQYQASAEFYKKAMQLGRRDIELNYAFSSIMSGNKEDASFVLAQLKNKEDNSIYSDMLYLNELRNVDQISTLDEAKQLQWFLYNLSSMSLPMAQKMFDSFNNPMVKVYAGSALCRYYIEKGDLVEGNNVFAKILEIQNLNKFAEGERNFTFLTLKTALKEGEILLEKSKSMTLNSDRELTRDFFMACGYEFKGDSLNASNYFIKTLSMAPYVESVIPTSIHFLSRHGRKQEAYDFLVEIVQNNPSVPMLKAYLELCLDMELVSYAETTLTDLKGRISAQEYSRYQNQLTSVQNQ